ncbi:MAG: hypothetical protein L0L09_10135, partial [Staphylococcus equorum]|nr:hypothetical protein [Staphylococcus equorum]
VRAMQLIDQAKSFMGVDDSGSISTNNNNPPNNDIIVELMKQNNRLLEALIGTVDNKDLIVDEDSLIDSVSRGLGKKHISKGYNKGGY